MRCHEPHCARKVASSRTSHKRSYYFLVPKRRPKNQGTLGNPIWIPSFTWVLQALSKLCGSGPTHTFATPDKTSYLAHINQALQKMSSHECVLLPLLFLHLSVSSGKHPPKSIPPSPRFTIKCSFHRIIGIGAASSAHCGFGRSVFTFFSSFQFTKKKKLSGVVSFLRRGRQPRNERLQRT